MMVHGQKPSYLNIPNTNWSKKSKAINWWTNGRAIIDLLSKVDGEDERPQLL